MDALTSEKVETIRFLSLTCCHMKLDTRAYGSAAAGTMGVIYLVCVVLSWLWPDAVIRLAGWLVHVVNVEQFAGEVRVTAGGFVMGLAQSVIYGFIVGWLFAWFYNRFATTES